MAPKRKLDEPAGKPAKCPKVDYRTNFLDIWTKNIFSLSSMADQLV